MKSNPFWKVLGVQNYYLSLLTQRNHNSLGFRNENSQKD